MASIMLNLSLDEIVVLGSMVSSFIECDEDYIRDPSQPDLEEVDGELKVLYSLREKLSKITELQMSYDPVHQNEDGSWWFWDEAQFDEYGPYDTERTARLEITRYCYIFLEVGCSHIQRPEDIEKGMVLINLEDRPFLKKHQHVTVASVGKKNDTFDVELAPGQFLIVHKNDYRCFVRKS